VDSLIACATVSPNSVLPAVMPPRAGAAAPLGYRY
jgi:hypothetical protein